MKRNYDNWNKNELVKYINELEDNFKKKNDDFLSEYKWAGNLGQWLWYVDNDKVVFNDLKVSTIGYDPKSLDSIGFKFFTDLLHPDDYERVMDNMLKHLKGFTSAYEVEYRIKHKDGHYLWYYDRGVATSRDENGKPIIVEGIVFDITESKKVEEKLIYLAERDILTNAYNRRMLFESIRKSIINYQNEKTSFGLIMIDIDHFKRVNDTYGHLTGDDLLIELSNLIVNQKKLGDTFYRYGGEEFFILLNNVCLQEVIKIGHELQSKIIGHEFKNVGKITVSMGIVEYKPNETTDEIIKRADDLMYEAKKSGRNNIKV